MKTVFTILFLTLVIAACSLNARQEASLSESTTNYIEARKAGALLAYVSMQHPEVVKHYKSKGDSAFVKKFNVEPKDYFSEDPFIKQIAEKGSRIHVLYEAKVIPSEWEQAEEEVRKFVAISENNGKSWFYMDWSDYVDKSVAPDFERMAELK